MTDAELLRALSALARLCAQRPDRASLLGALVVDVLRPLEAQAGGIGMIDEQGLLAIRTMHGFPTGTLRRGPRFALDDTMPLPDAVRRRTMIMGPYPRIVERYPALSAYESRGAHAHYLPLELRGAIVGGLMIGTEVAVRAPLAATFWSGVAAMTALALEAEDAPAPRVRAARAAPLTPRQLAILTLLREGRTNAQIARALTYGNSTIAHDIMRVFDALGARTRQEAVELAERAGLLDAAGENVQR